MTRKVVLPANCAQCVFRPATPAPGGVCRRHAPSPGHEEHELVYWPPVRATDRCGDGASVMDGQGPGVVACRICDHWLQPDGRGIQPDYDQGLPAAWWAESGYCTRRAPSPSTEDDRETHWRVTHAEEGCGDGQRVKAPATPPLLETVG